jgi:nucleoid-associated protein YgaU
MSRSLCLILAATISLAGCNLAYSQDAAPAAPAGDTVANIKAENAALKKEVSDAAKTIADLQSKLAQANTQLDAANAATASAKSDLASANAALAAAKAQPAPTSVAGDAPAGVPPGPQKALPLDATNVITTPGVPVAPGATAAATSGSSRSYTVVKGDSLWKIAHKMYPGDTKNGVDKIQDANKDAIGGKPLKIGQVLVIP